MESAKEAGSAAAKVGVKAEVREAAKEAGSAAEMVEVMVADSAEAKEGGSVAVMVGAKTAERMVDSAEAKVVVVEMERGSTNSLGQIPDQCT